MTPRRLLVCLAVVTCALGFAGLAMAQPEATDERSASSDADRARELYERGAEAFRASRYLEAIRYFEQANRAVPNPALSYNIALAYDSIGDTAAALRWYRDYLRRVPEAEDEDEVTGSVRRLEQELRKLGVQQVTITSSPPGAPVYLDGERVGVTPWTGEMTAGRHQVRLELEGYAPGQVEFSLPEDRAIDVSLTLVEARPRDPAPVAAPKSVAVEDETLRHRIRPGSWITLSVGVATLGAAGYAEAAAERAEQEARDASIQLDAADAADRMDRRRTTARILGSAGGVATLVGAGLLIRDLRTSRSARAHSWVPGLTCDPSGCMTTVRGRF